MKLIPYVIKDLRGGLNDRDTSSAIAANEAAVLENYYTDNQSLVELRGGSQLLQYAPVDPQPYVSDANTLALWHMDSVSGGVTDASGNGHTLRFFDSVAGGFIESGLLPTGAGLAVGLTPISVADDSTSDGTLAEALSSTTTLNNLSALTLDCLCYIPDSFIGGTQTFVRGGVSYTVSPNSGAILIGTVLNSDVVGSGEALQNGIQIFRPFDAVTNNNTGAPYLVARIQTSGIAGTVTEIQSVPLPTNTWLFIRLTYNSAKQVMMLYANAVVIGQAQVLGGGNIYDNGLSNVFVGSNIDLNYGNSGNYFASIFPGPIDETRISNIERTDFPFKKLRGKGFEYINASGTHQLVASAEDGLYYQTGSGGWTPMQTGFLYNASEPSFWDAKQLGDYLYLSDGLNQPKCWNGQQLLDWGNPTVPPTLALNGIAGPAAGTTNIAYTYLYGSVETGLSPVASIPNPSGYQVSAYAIPARFANCTGIRLYVQAQGSTAWYLWRQVPNTPNVPIIVSGPYVAGSPAGYSTDQGAFGVPDVDLGGATYAQISADALTAVQKKPKYLLMEHRRMFVCGQDDEPYTLRWSELDNADVFNVYSFTNAWSGRGPLIGLDTYYGEILVSENGRSTLILRGDSPSSFQQLETLHPTVGCVDHWGFVHHYPITDDRYVLAFPAKDGFYAYSGQDLEKISDKINGTFATLAQQSANRQDWILNTQAEFQSNLVNGGSATVNVEQGGYENDGLRQNGGQLGPFNQLNYLGLWSNSSPLVPGRVIAVCAGMADGQFYFATDYDQTLYHTSNNFVSVDQSLVNAAMGSTERIIEIVKQGASDAYMCLTDSRQDNQLATISAEVFAPATNPIFSVNTTAPFYVGQIIDIFQAGGIIPLQRGLVVTAIGTGQITTNALTVNVLANSIILAPGTQASSAGGFAYSWNNTAGAWSNALSQKLFYDLDVPVSLFSKAGYSQAAGAGSNGTNLDYNILGIDRNGHTQNYAPGFINHAQTIYWNYRTNPYDGSNAYDNPFVSQFFIENNNTPGVAATPNVITGNVVFGRTIANAIGSSSTYYNSSVALNPGFYTFSGIYSTGPNQVNYTRREFPSWLGGSFRPQAFWDAANGHFVFLASTVENAIRNRSTNIYSWDASTPVSLQYAPAVPSGSFGIVVSAIATDGTHIYAWVNKSAPGSGTSQVDSTTGFQSYLAKALLTSISAMAQVGGVQTRNLALRLSYNSSNTALLVSTNKSFNSIAYGSVDTYSYNGTIQTITLATASLATLLTLANVDDYGQFVKEIAVQTDAPNCWLLASDRINDGSAVYSLGPNAALTNLVSVQVAPYAGTGISNQPASGILSNLIFSASSGAGNGYLWSDRIYFSTNAAASSDSRLIQLGIPGQWTVKGEYISPINNLGAFAAFNTLTTDSTQDFSIYLRNAATADPVALAANEIQVTPGQFISAPQFDPPAAYAQWRIDWTWVYDYTVAKPQAVPFLTYVDVSYYVGKVIVLPRVTGQSYLGRAYWTVASGQTSGNNMVLVWQKTRTWMKILGWSLDSIFGWNGHLAGIGDYDLAILESGTTDLGAKIVGRVRTGTQLGFVASQAADGQPAFAQMAHMLGFVDKLLARVQANVNSYVDPSGQNIAGYVILTPLAADVPLPGSAWVVAVPGGNQATIKRILGVPYLNFGYDWARAWALEIKSSEDTTGAWISPAGIPEIIQSLDLMLEITEDAYDLPVT